ncbi:hypothetical protein ABIE44_002125 [Marmoricola sp. OAE513]
MLAPTAVARSWAARACRASSAAVPLDRTSRGQCLDVRGVHPDPLARQQVAVHGLGEQRVPEAVEVVAGGHQDVELDGLAQRGLEVGGGHSGHLGEQRVGDPTAGDGRGPHHLVRHLAETVQTDQQQVGQVLGHRAARHGGRADELLDEERIALGARHDAGDVRLAQRFGVQLLDQRPHVAGTERLELHPADPGHPAPLGSGAAQRVPSVQVVGPVRRDDRDRVLERAGEQEADQVAGGGVGPVDVLEHQQQRGGGRDPVEQSVHRVEQVTPSDRRRGVLLRALHRPTSGLEGPQHRALAGGLLEQVGDLGREPAHHLGERQVGQRAVAEVEAVPGDHLPTLGERDVAQLGEDPGLADARVPGQQHRAVDRSGTPDAEDGGELVQLGLATDQRRDVVGVLRERHATHDDGCDRQRRPVIADGVRKGQGLDRHQRGAAPR